MNNPYTKEQICLAVENSKCYSDVFRQLGLKINGGSYDWMKRTIKKFDLETSHFLKRRELLRYRSKKKKSETNQLTSNTIGKRIRAKTLRLFMISHGKNLQCNICDLSSWRNKTIILDIDHINEDCRNNNIDNLQFLCPNCHRQKTHL